MPENTSQLSAKDVMTDRYTKADVNDSISSLLSSMKRDDTDSVLVFDGKKVIGIASHSGLLRNVDFQKTKVATIVRSVPKITLNQSFDSIVRTMKEANTHIIPVIEKNQVVGVVDAQSLLSRMRNAESIQLTTASAMATTQPVTANENDQLGKVLKQLKESHMRKIPVLDNKGKLSGVLKLDMIAEDILLTMDRKSDDAFHLGKSSKSVGKSSALNLPIKSLMDENPITVRGNEKGSKVVEMLTKQTNPLLIISENGQHAVITIHNVFNAYLNQTQTAITTKEDNFIQTTHLPDVDEIDKAKIDSMISKTFNKMQRVMKGELRMNVVYKQSKKMGMRAKTEVNIKVQGTGRPFSAHAEDWKVLLATKEACSALESEINKRYKQRDSKERTR